MKVLKVLVVDDSPRWGEMISRIVEAAGHEATVAHSGNQAIEMISEANEFDRVITDTRMDDGDGIKLLQFIYDKYGPGTRAVAYIHSSDNMYLPENDERIDLDTEIPKRFPGTVFNRKSTSTSDDITEFLRG